MWLFCSAWWLSRSGQHMRLRYLSHRWPAKAQASLRICAVSPESSLFAHMKYGRSRRVRPKIRHLAQLDGCACAFEEWAYGGWKMCHNLMSLFINSPIVFGFGGGGVTFFLHLHNSKVPFTIHYVRLAIDPLSQKIPVKIPALAVYMRKHKYTNICQIRLYWGPRFMKYSSLQVLYNSKWIRA